MSRCVVSRFIFVGAFWFSCLLLPVNVCGATATVAVDQNCAPAVFGAEELAGALRGRGFEVTRAGLEEGGRAQDGLNHTVCSHRLGGGLLAGGGTGRQGREGQGAQKGPAEGMDSGKWGIRHRNASMGFRRSERWGAGVHF